MATNKRKDSAALFELIDKSTLKVPKHTGSLKIPSWWSSKSNPPAPAGQAMSGAATMDSRPTAIGAQRPPNSQAALQPAGPQHGAAAPQSRLFEPPPADIPGAASPSIRPPAPPAGPRFAMVTASESAAATEPSQAPDASVAEGQAPPAGATAGMTATAEISEQEVESDPLLPEPPNTLAPAARRIFAPQTMSQNHAGRADWGSLQKARLARAPLWAMVAGAAGIVVLLVLVIYTIVAFSPRHSPKPNPAPISNSLDSGAARTPSLQPLHSPLPNTASHDHAGLLETQRDTAPAAARVFEPGTVQRSPQLYYIEIATSPLADIARRNANLIAKNGVDVSIETQMSRNNRLLYKLISVQGFSTYTEAAPLQRKIVAIGHLLPEFARTRKAWDDATIIKWSSLVKAAARG